MKGISARLLFPTAALAALLFGLLAPVRETPDSSTYLAPARSWAAGEGLREADGSPLTYRMPAYPLALGVSIRLFGETESHQVIGIMNVGFLLLAALLISRSCFPMLGPAGADLAAAAILIYPPLLASTALVLQEVFVAFLLAALFLATRVAVSQPGPGAPLLAGLALGLAALGKPTVFAVALPLLALVWTSQQKGAKRSLSFLLGATMILAPWALRNRMAVGRFELAPGNAGHTLFGGTVSNQIDEWFDFPEYRIAVAEWKSTAGAGQVPLDRYLAEVALSRIADHPLRWAALCAERLGRFMLPARTWFVQVGLSENGTFSPLYLLATAVNITLFGLTGWLALTALRARDPAAAVGPVIVFSHMVLYAVTYVSPRYAVTITPLLIASSLEALRSRHGMRSPRNGEPAGSG